MASGVRESNFKRRRVYKARYNENVYGLNRINDWLEDKERPVGMNKISADLFREIKDVDKHFSRNNTILYYLLKNQDMQVVRNMMISTSRVRNLLWTVMSDLKQYGVTHEWEPMFRKNITSLRKRADYVFYIIKKDLEETELYPYFEAVGFERLVDFSVKYNGGEKEQSEQLDREISEWNAGHQEEIKAHMERMAEQIKNRDEHRQKIKEAEREEKVSKRLARKIENAEVREIRQNNKRHASRERRINRSFDRYRK